MALPILLMRDALKLFRQARAALDSWQAMPAHDRQRVQGHARRRLPLTRHLGMAVAKLAKDRGDQAAAGEVRRLMAEVASGPDWSGRATVHNKNVAAFCDVEVYDRGDAREVVVTRGHRFASGGMSKKLMNGIARAIEG